jgi:hypothetical protein
MVGPALKGSHMNKNVLAYTLSQKRTCALKKGITLQTKQFGGVKMVTRACISAIEYKTGVLRENYLYVH